jgi:CheY-like chemotaxis protein
LTDGHRAPQRGQSQARDAAVARILIVDDDPQLIDILALAFDDAGHEVITARDGADGLAVIGRERRSSSSST